MLGLVLTTFHGPNDSRDSSAVTAIDRKGAGTLRGNDTVTMEATVT